MYKEISFLIPKGIYWDAVIVIFERMERMKRILYYTFGWENYIYIERINIWFTCLYGEQSHKSVIRIFCIWITWSRNAIHNFWYNKLYYSICCRNPSNTIYIHTYSHTSRAIWFIKNHKVKQNLIWVKKVSPMLYLWNQRSFNFSQ